MTSYTVSGGISVTRLAGAEERERMSRDGARKRREIEQSTVEEVRPAPPLRGEVFVFTRHLAVFVAFPY